MQPDLILLLPKVNDKHHKQISGNVWFTVRRIFLKPEHGASETLTKMVSLSLSYLSACNNAARNAMPRLRRKPFCLKLAGCSAPRWGSHARDAGTTIPGAAQAPGGCSDQMAMGGAGLGAGPSGSQAPGASPPRSAGFPCWVRGARAVAKGGFGHGESQGRAPAGITITRGAILCFAEFLLLPRR